MQAYARRFGARAESCHRQSIEVDLILITAARGESNRFFRLGIDRTEVLKCWQKIRQASRDFPYCFNPVLWPLLEHSEDKYESSLLIDAK